VQFFSKYLSNIAESVNNVDARLLRQLADIFRSTREVGRKVVLVGNGGSAAIAAHVALDLTKAANVRAISFSEAALLTCFANDYGYEHWVEKALEFYADPGDAAVLISSSGRSTNIVDGAKLASARKLRVVTLSGFDADNPLRRLGELNLWVNSRSYNVVEMTHHVWLVAAVDRLVAEEADRT